MATAAILPSNGADREAARATHATAPEALLHLIAISFRCSAWPKQSTGLGEADQGDA
jgi:hypothetical protein